MLFKIGLLKLEKEASCLCTLNIHFGGKTAYLVVLKTGKGVYFNTHYLLRMLTSDGLDIHTAHAAEYESRTLNTLLGDRQIVFMLGLHHFLGKKTVNGKAFDGHVQNFAEIFTILTVIRAYTHPACLTSAAGHYLSLEHEGKGHRSSGILGAYKSALRQRNAVLAQKGFSLKFK